MIGDPAAQTACTPGQRWSVPSVIHLIVGVGERTVMEFLVVAAVMFPLVLSQLVALTALRVVLAILRR